MRHLVLILGLYLLHIAPIQAQSCTLTGSLQNGLVGYWPFCGNANDESGNGNDGVVNGATLTEDRFGNATAAYTFDGESNNIIVEHSSSLNFENSQTISLWVKHEQGAEGWLISKGCENTSLENGSFRFYSSLLNGGLGRSIIADNWTPSRGWVESEIPFNENWSHFVSVYDGQTINLYVNGDLLVSNSQTGPINNTLGNLLFGSRTHEESFCLGDNFFNGNLDDIGIWNRALTAEEITDLFNDYSPLITYYLDNDGDTFGDPNSSVETNTGMPVGYSANNVDCDDTNELINIPEPPIFNSFGPFCAGSDIPSLPTISANGLEGLWSPAINNLVTTTYTFTPNINQCAYPGNYTVEILTIPQVSIINSVSCVEQVATITAIVEPLGNYEYNWLVPAEAQNPGNVASFSTSIDGLYSVVVNSACFDSSHINTQNGDTIIVCPMVYFPVCGCDGETYGNECCAYTQGITHYSFGECSGIASFYCPSTEATTEVSIQTSNTPTFGSFGPYCSGSSIPTLPTTSQNGISGSWSPAINNQETTSYTFTPDAGQCASSVTRTITITPTLTPSFGIFGPYCAGSSIPGLPTTSTNGITGNWSPAINNQATTTYTFTPNAGQCTSSITRTISIAPTITPSFGIFGPYCADSSIPGLPTTSTNGITGNWSPAINNQATTTYTFTPNAGQCASSVTHTISIAQTVITCYLDEDNDGWGIEGTFIQTCDCPAGYSDISGDCDDTNNQSNPDAPEVCLDQIDNNCNIEIDEECLLGCTSFDACNFDWLATIDDGSCTFEGDACDDGNTTTINDVLGADCSCVGILVEIGAPHTCGAPLVHNPNLSYGSMTDQEGNVYKTIVIGDQEWMAENLKVSHYANGDTISSLTNDADWFNTNTGAWCYFNNDSQYDCPYGKLYNWYATVDSRSLCPSNWHVPTYGEWWELIAFLGGQEAAGGLLKSSGNSTTGNGIWNDPNLGGTNGSGFSAIPSGNRVSFGLGFGIGSGAGWWTSTIEQIESAWAFYILNDISDVRQYFGASQRFGFSMRCVRNEDTGLIPGCTDPLACNYEDTATIDNGSCLYPGFSCDDENVLTENDTLDDSCTCIGTPITGCTDPLASNFNPLATINEGCEYTVANDTLFCNEITTPVGPGIDIALTIVGIVATGLGSDDFYSWTGSPSLVFSDDGQGRLVGDVIALNNPTSGWHVDMTFSEGLDWAAWSASGGLFTDDLALNAANHTSWTFYKLEPTISRLDGFGEFAGDQLLLSHQPLNYAYGYQFGIGANNKNLDNGGYGSFFFSGIVGGQDFNGQGNMSLSMQCSITDLLDATIFVYNDLNGNGEHESNEPGLTNWPVLGNNINGLVWTNGNGNAFLPLETGSYEFTVLNTTENWVSTTPTSVTIDLTSGPATASFGLQVIPGEAIVAAGPFTGFWDILHCTEGYESGVYLENIGSQAVSGFMTLTCDPLFTPDADSYFTTPPVEVGPGYALWNVEDFLPGEYELLSFHIDGPGVEYLNQSFTFDFDITLFDPQGNMIYSDNWSVSPIVACAYDPNDITGFPEGLSAPHEEGYTIEHYILPDNMVEFRVRFQNTGTLPAEDIDIYIPLDPNQWELSTIFPLMRSAEMQVVCLHDDGTVDLVLLEHELPEGVTAQDLLIFSFDDIYLPDSASNPEGSQGYVYFRMQAKHTLNIGDEINAQAFIYFEQNPAVVTNETYHVIFDCTSFTPMVGDIELCAGEALQFSASQPNVDDYAWNIGSLEGSGNIFLFEGIDAGEYTLELNTSNMLCPQGEDHQVNVIVHDIPQLDVPLDETVCEGEELTFEAESDGAITWSNGANTGDTFTADQSFTVTATALGEGNCSTSEDWSVTVNPLPSAAVDSANFVLTAADGVAWQWSVNGAVDATTQSITATENGNYQVEITNEFGCVAMSDVVAVELPIPDNVFVHSWSTLALFPNPMTTSARLELPQGAFDIALYDLTGACVRTLANQQGMVVIERESLTSGVYHVKVSQGEVMKSVRMIVE